jgi:hypothetical protein
MRRIFWLAMGITIGALIVRRLSRVAGRLTPSGAVETMSGALSELAASLRDFASDVRSSMVEREAELREGTGMDGSYPNDSGAPPRPATPARPGAPVASRGEADHR